MDRMLDCRTFEADLEALLDGALAPERATACRAHLASCADCRELMELARVAGGEAAAAAPPPELLAGVLAATTGRGACGRCRELLCDHVDTALAPPEEGLVTAHLARCDDCAELAAVLARLARDLPTLAELDPGPGFTAGVLARTLPLEVRLRRWWSGACERWSRRPRFALEAAYAGTVALVLVVSAPGSPAGDLAERALELARSRPSIELAEPIAEARAELARTARSTLEPTADRALDRARRVVVHTGHAAENVRRSFGTLFEGAASSSTGADETPRPNDENHEETLP